MTTRSYMGPIQPIQTVWFAGLSTRGSLAFQVFPAWAAEVGVRARLHGIDLPPGAPAERYRAFVRDLRSRQHVVGAVVTAHKVALFESARDELDHVD